MLATAPECERPAARIHSRNYRWVICGLIFAATSINYLDRQVLAILAPTLQRQIGWNEQEYGHIVTAFQAAYAIGFLGFGKYIDVFGTKVGYGLAVAVWSVAACGHSLARSALGFGVARFGLGLGEGGNFPGAIKGIAEWFPQKERALATGLFNSGCNVGAILAPLAVPWLTQRYGWQGSFIVLGALGFIWLLAWGCLYGPAGRTRQTSGSGKADQGGAMVEDGDVPWLKIVTYRQSWVYIVGIALTAPIFWFYLYWTPKFLFRQFGLDLGSIGRPLIIIYSLATVGSIAGGWLSSTLIERGCTLNVSRKVSLLLCALCSVPVFLVPIVRSSELAVWLIGVAAAGHMGWAGIVFTTVSDLFPARAVASVVGVGGMFSGIMAMAFSEFAGFTLQRTGSYLRLFEIASVTYLVALLVMHLLEPRYERLTETGAVRRPIPSS